MDEKMWRAIGHLIEAVLYYSHGKFRRYALNPSPSNVPCNRLPYRLASAPTAAAIFALVSRCRDMMRLVEETEAHVLVGLLLLLLLGGLWGVLGGSGTTGSTTSSSWGGGSATTGSNVQEQLLDILALEGLGEERSPDGLNVGDLGSGDERLELVGGDLDTVIREDEGGVGGSELGGGHFVGF